jgi:hypothetical protein
MISRMPSPGSRAIAISGMLVAGAFLLLFTGCRAEIRRAQRLEALHQAAAEIEGRIERARAVEEIENLISIYGYYLESFIWDPLADLFAEDGSIEIAHRGVYVGRKRVRDNLELYGVNGLHPRELHPHIPLQSVIHVAPDGQSAKIRRRAWLEMGVHGGTATWGEGVYEDEAVKRDGVWRFKKVHVMNTFFAPYEGGWEVTTERRNPGVSSTNPPDLPPTLQYGIFPEVYIPAFHYENPGKMSRADHAYNELRPLSDGGFISDMERWTSTLSRDVSRIEDELELRNLQGIFGYYFDKCLWDDVVALFSESGTFEVAQVGVYAGKKSIRRFLDAYGEQPISRGRLNNHMQLQPIITVAEGGATAKARWHLWAQLGKVSLNSQWGEGIYENEYVKEDGVWKISKLHFFPNMYTDYQKGWGKQAYQIGDLLAAAPKPDRPPTVSAPSYPQSFVPPFHYANPVTGK